MSTFMVFCTLLVMVMFSSRATAFLFQAKRVCYKDLDCFSSGPPFESSARPISALPSKPEHIKTQFILYTRATPTDGEVLDALDLTDIPNTWNHFAKDSRTLLIVHGFLDDYNIISWLKDMKDELLKHGDHNAIIVDWHHGNSFPYTQATANTRVVGAQIAVLIKQLQKDFNVSASQFHIIGHSLGAHVAGYAGERVPGLARITGLDPAGPYYQGTDKVVRLDPTDADLVDSIHTDDKDILQFGLGMKQPVGHMDFYPNLGHDQPGCSLDPIKSLTDLYSLGIANGVEEMVGCDHLRSMRYFLESINSKCPFMAVPCNSQEDFEANKCLTCPPTGCVSMGFRADQHRPPNGAMVKYYTTTASSAPFCQYHMDVKLKMSQISKASSERGTATIRIQGDLGATHWLPLNTDPKYYNPGDTYEVAVIVPTDIGKIQYVQFQWHHVSSVYNPLKYNWFGLRHPKLFVEEVDVLMEEQGNDVHFCAGNIEVDNNEPVSVRNKC